MAASGSGSATGVVTVPIHAAYPMGSDLQAYLEAGRFTLSADLIALLDGYARAGAELIEQQTNRRFIAVAGTRYFEPSVSRNAVVDLHDDLSAVVSVILGGTTLTVGTNYRLLPENAVNRGWPWGQLQMVAPWTLSGISHRWDKLEIDGDWGWGAAIPELVWQAMLAAAALYAFPSLAHSLTGPLESWRATDGTSESYGSKPYQIQRERWQMVIDSAVQLYTRVEFG